MVLVDVGRPFIGHKGGAMFIVGVSDQDHPLAGFPFLELHGPGPDDHLGAPFVLRLGHAFRRNHGALEAGQG